RRNRRATPSCRRTTRARNLVLCPMPYPAPVHSVEVEPEMRTQGQKLISRSELHTGPTEGVDMKSLPEQLNDLADGARKTEDFVNAARAKNRAVLDEAQESLKTSIANGEARIDADAAAPQDTARSWWNDTRQSIHARAAQLRAQRDDRHAA